MGQQDFESINNNVEESADEPAKYISHVIFDLDGTLLDTEAQYYELEKHVLKKLGKDFTTEAKREVLGLSTEAEVKRLIEMYDLNISSEEYLKMYEDEFGNYLCDGTALDGSNNLITHFYKHNIPMAICTNSTRAQYDHMLSKFENWRKMIPLVMTAGDDPEITKTKPDPQPYITVSRRFSSKPKSAAHVIVFEDSVAGATAAVKAGHTVVFVAQPRFGLLDTSDELKEIRPRLHEVIKSLTEFKPEKYGLPAYKQG